MILLFWKQKTLIINIDVTETFSQRGRQKSKIVKMCGPTLLLGVQKNPKDLWVVLYLSVKSGHCHWGIFYCWWLYTIVRLFESESVIVINQITSLWNQYFLDVNVNSSDEIFCHLLKKSQKSIKLFYKRQNQITYCKLSWSWQGALMRYSCDFLGL